MVGRGASLDGRLFLAGTDGSNPVPTRGGQQTFGSSQDDDTRCSKQPRNLRRHGLRCNPRWDAAFLTAAISLALPPVLGLISIAIAFPA
jgi:hypothetical protein